MNVRTNSQDVGVDMSLYSDDQILAALRRVMVDHKPVLDILADL